MNESHDNFEGLTLGEQLRRYREAVGMSVEEVARKIKISSRYVRALEQEDWAVFSAKVYAQGATRRMANLFNDADTNRFAAACGREWDMAYGSGGNIGHTMPHAVGRPRRFMVTPRRLGIAASVGMAVLLIVFLSMRLTAFITAPGLTIHSPADRSLFTASIVDVSGKTEKESSLTVNGREITLDEQGNFDEKIELPPGATALHFISRNRFGKIQTTVRNILVE